MGAVPVDRARQTLLEGGEPRLPAQLGPQPGRVDRIAQVVPGPVGDVVEVVRVVAQLLQDHPDHLQVGPLPVRADQVGRPHPAPVEDRPHRAGVVIGMDPVAHVLPRAVELDPAPGEQVGDLTRDELLHVLPRAVVVRAVRQRRRHPEGAHPRPHQMVRRGLGRRVGRGGPVCGVLGEPLRVVQLQVAVDLVGGDVVHPHPVPAHRLQQRERPHDVGRDERGRVVQGVVVVRLGRIVHQRVPRTAEPAHQLVHQRRVADVPLHQLDPVGRQTRQRLRRGRIRQLVQHRHVHIGVLDQEVDEVGADEPRTTRHQKPPHGSQPTEQVTPGSRSRPPRRRCPSPRAGPGCEPFPETDALRRARLVP